MEARVQAPTVLPPRRPLRSGLRAAIRLRQVRWSGLSAPFFSFVAWYRTVCCSFIIRHCIPQLSITLHQFPSSIQLLPLHSTYPIMSLFPFTIFMPVNRRLGERHRRALFTVIARSTTSVLSAATTHVAVNYALYSTSVNVFILHPRAAFCVLVPLL